MSGHEIERRLEEIHEDIRQMREHLLEYTKMSSRNRQDLLWVKGGIKILAAGFFTLVSGATVAVIQWFKA